LESQTRAATPPRPITAREKKFREQTAEGGLALSRRAAKQLLCGTTLRSWAQASLGYAADHRTKLPNRGPEANAFISPNIVGSGFRSRVDGYGLKQVSGFCPEGVISKDRQAQVYSAWGGTMGYSYYAYLINPPQPRSPRTTLDDQDQAGRQSLLFGDVHRYGAGLIPIHTNHPTPGRRIYAYSSGLGWDLLCSISRGINNAYIDGHVEWIEFSQLNTAIYSQAAGDGSASYHWKK